MEGLGKGRGKVEKRYWGKLAGSWEGFSGGLGYLRARVKGEGNSYKYKGTTNRDIEQL